MPRHSASVVRTCEVCNATYSVYPSEVKRGRKRFCSQACRATRTAVKSPKAYARSCVNTAVRAGQLVRPECCSRCQRPCKPQAHHPDYSRPLDVVWLCQPCHDEESAPARREVMNRRRKHLLPCPCGKPAVTRGFCRGCYMREHYKPTRTTPCRVPGCGRLAHSRGLCDTHRHDPEMMRQFALPSRRPNYRRRAAS